MESLEDVIVFLDEHADSNCNLSRPPGKHSCILAKKAGHLPSPN